MSATISHTPIVAELVDIITKNNWLNAFNEAVSIAVSFDTRDLKEEQIYDLDSFFSFLDRFVTWRPTEHQDGKYVYNRIAVFYWIFDQEPLKRKDIQNPIHPIDGQPPFKPLTVWVIKFAKTIGSHLSKQETITAETIATFEGAENYKVHEYKVPEGGWKSFNHFFARELKDFKSQRPIMPLNDPQDPTIIVNGADACFYGYYPVTPDGKITFDAGDQGGSVTVKGIEWPIKVLLEGSGYEDAFDGGIFAHSFLSTFDYHRQHSPVNGYVRYAKVIEGQAYLGVYVVNENEEKVIRPRRRVPEAVPTNSFKEDDGTRNLAWTNAPGYQFVQTRGLIIIESKIGLVAVLPIGMGHVSSVVLNEENVQKDKWINKGDEISHFEFGGSDIIYVFQKRSNVKILVEWNKKKHIHYLVGTALAKADLLPEYK